MRALQTLQRFVLDMINYTPLYGSVSSPYWDSEDVWIVAGGPSAKTFDYSRLKYKRVVLVNDAIKVLPSLKRAVVFSLDSSWILSHRDFLRDFQGEKFLAIPLDTFPECGEIPGATYLKWSYMYGLSEDPTTVCTGCNSGYAAVNLAYLKRAQEIHLVGYDLDPKDNDQYYYWARLFSNMLPQLRKRCVSVINHNPKTFIDAFSVVAY